MAWPGNAIRTHGEYRSEEVGKQRGARTWPRLTIIHFQLPFPLLLPASLPSPNLKVCKQGLRDLGQKERPSPAWGWKVPALHTGPAAGPGLHQSHYSWQAWARERGPCAAGISWAKLFARTREETLHFVPRDGQKHGGRSGDANRNTTVQNLTFFVCFVF